MPEGTEGRLQTLGIRLPTLPTPGRNYVSKTVGPVVYLASVVSTNATGVITATVDAERTIEDGYAAARVCTLTLLAVLRPQNAPVEVQMAVEG